MKSSAVRPLAGLGLVVALAADLRARHRLVPWQLHRNRSGDGDFGARRPGDEPRRQGQDARRAGRQGGRRSRTAPTGRPSCTWPWTRRSCSSSRPTSSSTSPRTTVFGAKFVQLDAAAGSVARETARGSGAFRASTSPSRSTPSSSKLVDGAGQDRPGEAQRDARRDRDGLQRPRREVRPDVGRLQRAAGQDRTQPAESRRMTSRRPCRRSTPTPMRHRT